MEKFRILIADDDDYFIITEVFNEFMKHDISHVKDGQQLIWYLDNQAEMLQEFPDLILLDINMPKIDGITALQYIKAVSHLSRIPVVIYTTSSDKRQKEKCLELGANGFASKAANYSEVFAFVRSINVFLNELRTNPLKMFVHKIKPVTDTK